LRRERSGRQLDRPSSSSVSVEDEPDEEVSDEDESDDESGSES
jgi:hypothetical protein